MKVYCKSTLYELYVMAESAQVEVIESRVEDVSDRESHTGSDAGVSKDKSISQKLLFWKTDSNTRKPPGKLIRSV